MIHQWSLCLTLQSPGVGQLLVFMSVYEKVLRLKFPNRKHLGFIGQFRTNEASFPPMDEAGFNDHVYSYEVHYVLVEECSFEAETLEGNCAVNQSCWDIPVSFNVLGNPL
jgi:hypothetical protein